MIVLRNAMKNALHAVSKDGIGVIAPLTVEMMGIMSADPVISRTPPRDI